MGSLLMYGSLVSSSFTAVWLGAAVALGRLHKVNRGTPLFPSNHQSQEYELSGKYVE